MGQKSTMKHGAATAQMRKGPNKTCGEGNGKAGAGSRHWAWDQGTWEDNFSPSKRSWEMGWKPGPHSDPRRQCHLVIGEGLNGPGC